MENVIARIKLIMTDALLITKVLESCGWALSSAEVAKETWSVQKYKHSDGRLISRSYAASILTSLDACREVFEKDAPDEYWDNVFYEINPAYGAWEPPGELRHRWRNTCKATPRQRCLAWLRYKGIAI